jgi:N-acylneuraminate cytidylyltransferase
VSFNYDYSNRPRSQTISRIEYIENGAFYIFSRKNFLKYKNRLHGKIGYYEMLKDSLFEIDDPEDLLDVEKLLK